MPLKKNNETENSEKKIIGNKPAINSKKKTKKKVVLKKTKKTEVKSINEKTDKKKFAKLKLGKSQYAKSDIVKKNILKKVKVLKIKNNENISKKQLSESLKNIKKLSKTLTKKSIVKNEKLRLPTINNDLSNAFPIKKQKLNSIAIGKSNISLNQKSKNRDVELKQISINENKPNKKIIINKLTTINEFANKININIEDVSKKLFSIGGTIVPNQILDRDTIILLASELGYDAEFSSSYHEEKKDFLTLKLRPPIVTIMGHVNHGKTSLIDAIRSSDVVASEYGGITQHIGAYKINISNEKSIVLLDTPGHEIFTTMRLRGSKITDIIVLVISALDGIMPQTIEVINLAKAVDVPIIVAINKIDLSILDSKKIRNDLSNYGLIPEEWGGDTIMIDISAKQKTNIDLLIEMILLKAEIMELKADSSKNAKGVVIEAKLDTRRGIVVTLLVQDGTLKIGDNFVVGSTHGKIKAINDEHKKKLIIVPPSTPVEILGINEFPTVGDEFVVVNNESQAKQIVQSRKKMKETFSKSDNHLSLNDISLKKTRDLRIILKTDVQGSLEALLDALKKLSTHHEEVNLKIIHKGTGAITESDVALAVASNAIIIGFNLRPDATVEKFIELKKINVNTYRVIYDLIADIKAAMEGLLDPYMKEKIFGKAVVKQIFKLSNYGTIFGCYVVDGKIQRGTTARVLRNNIIIFDGNISSLKRFKDDIKEVEKGYECGIGFENFFNARQGDIIESYMMEKIIRKFDDNR
ncbi:MAG: translation initiation factor IF-2 [Endomicrobium sp.]|jgi:translation initiation factor IF-2|nr:translation initiation factor IF-2 [Endomicrobium sp.]